MKYTEGPIHDPFTEPVGFSFEDAEFDKRVLDALVPEDQRREYFVVARCASVPRNVLGAQPLGRCVACKERVWVSPSALSLVLKSTYVCKTCFISTVEKLLKEEDCDGNDGNENPSPSP